MTNIMAAAVVIDKTTAPRISKDMEELGGAWTSMFVAWQRSGYDYLVLLADTEERVRLRAPLTYMAVDEHALRQSLDDCCRRLVGKRCQWSLFMDKRSAAAHSTREQLLIEFQTEGHA